MYLEPIKTDSLVEAFVKRFEELIVSGRLTIGQKIPSEREIAKQLGISRPVVHEGLIILEQKGLVSIRPRHGVTVNDYRRQGSLAILQSLITYGSGQLEPRILESLLETRKLIELETVKLAALNRTEEHRKEFMLIITEEQSLLPSHTRAIMDVDFRFHHLIAIASGNVVYPLLLNSFKQVYTNLTYQFFLNPDVVEFVFEHHKKLTKAIAKKDSKSAVKIMMSLLNHGQRHLKNYIRSNHKSNQ